MTLDTRGKSCLRNDVMECKQSFGTARTIIIALQGWQPSSPIWCSRVNHSHAFASQGPAVFATSCSRSSQQWGLAQVFKLRTQLRREVASRSASPSSAPCYCVCMYVVRNSYQDLRLGCRWLTRDVHYYCYYSITNTSKYRWGARAYTSHNFRVRGSGSSVWHVIFKLTPSLQIQRTKHPFLELLRSLIPTPLSTNVN